MIETIGNLFRSLRVRRLQKKVSPGIMRDISWGIKSGSSLLTAVGERSNDPRILVRATTVVKAVTGRGRCIDI